MLTLSRLGIMALSLALGTALPAQFPFVRSTLMGAQSTNPTSLQWGPDDRLYVSQVNGEIDIYTVQKTPMGYQVIATETITSVRDLPNHDDNGVPQPSVTGRVCTGILVVGTAVEPVIYVTSSDPRSAIAFDSGLDTNSGVLTRLTWDSVNSTWVHLDLIRGLPRNEENHASNGMVLHAASNTLYLAQGGHTNMGAPSTNFAFQSEYALSSAILAIDLTALGNTTYDLPTLDDPRADETRMFNGQMQLVDVNDPFGGNDGQNQALLLDSGPIEIYSPGFRNAYDLVLLPDGRLYTIDNGPNGGWGGPPIGCGDIPNETNSRTYFDALHFVGNVNTDPAGTYYGGHPNLTRGNRSNTWNGVSPVAASLEDPRECIYELPFGSNNPPPAPHNTFGQSLISWLSSTNGFDVYTASNFAGALDGQFIISQYNGDVVRVELDATGTQVVDAGVLATGSTRLLDIDTVPDGGVFPGTVWIAGYSSSSIDILEPDDGSLNCTGADDPMLDEDSDGYDNADEIDAGTDPCSSASRPADEDLDFISNVNDPDDDNDGIPDVDDPFATDPSNGLLTAPRVRYGWALGTPGYGILGLGFSGLMTDGQTPWHDLFDPNKMAAGGAAGLVTVEQVAEGAPFLLGGQSGFQFGVNLDSADPLTRFRTTIRAPYFSARDPIGLEMVGMQVGTGSQDDYVAVVLSGLFGLEPSALLILEEQAGVVTRADVIPGSWLGGMLQAAESIELGFDIDPAAGTYVPMITLAPWGEFPLSFPSMPGTEVLQAIQSPTKAVATGLWSSSIFGLPFDAIWDDISVSPDEPSAVVVVDPQGTSIDASTYNANSFAVTNTSEGTTKITSVSFDLSTCVLPDIVFDPAGTAGDIVAKPFQLDADGGTSLTMSSFNGSFHNGVDGADGYDELVLSFADFGPGETMSFSIDNDPLSIKGTTAPGPNEAGSISGLELIGATVTVSFDDGTVHTQRLSRLGTTVDAARADVRTTGPAPTLQFLPGVTDPEVTNPQQMVRITARPNAFVRVTRMEGCLFVNGSPNPMSGPYPQGYQIDPDEVNSIVSVDSVTVFTGPRGQIDVPVTLTRFQGDGSYTLGPNDVTGLNYITAEVVEDNETNLRGPTAAPLVFHLVPQLVVGPMFRVNAGGAQTAALDGGIPWSADTSGAPSPYVNSNQQNSVYSIGQPITLDGSVPATVPTSLFQSERFTNNPLAQTWSFPVPFGQTVDVNLYFAEVFFQNPNQRVFDVTVEGQLLVDDLDLAGDYGLRVGTKFTTQVVSDGTINIQLVPGIENPKISAIEIVGY
jgi:glucose/arabinose dehydrogenase